MAYNKAVVIALILGIVITISGVVLVVIGNPKTEFDYKDINSLKNFTGKWEESRKNFDNSKFSYLLNNSGGLEKDDFIKFTERDPEIPQDVIYTPLKYILTRDWNVTDIPFQTHVLSPSDEYEFVFIGQEKGTIKFLPTPLFYITVVTLDEKSCRENFGVFDSSTTQCTQYWKSNGICVRLFLSTRNIWVIPSQPHSGCYPIPPQFGTEWPLGSYELLKASANGPPIGNFNFKEVEIIIRHEDDLYIKAAEITNGTFNFTPEKQIIKDVKRDIGFALIAIGLFLRYLCV